MTRFSSSSLKTKALALALLLGIFAAFFSGQYQMSLGEVLDFFAQLFGFAQKSQDFSIKSAIFFNVRLPRVLGAVLIGASLALCGASYQALFVNPLVSPGILGVTAGASFGAALGLMFKLSYLWVGLFAFVFGTLAVLFALFVSLIYKKGPNPIMLVLGGVISSALFGSLLSIAKYSADPYDALPAIIYWLMGSLSFASFKSVTVLGPIIFASCLLLLFLGKYLNALSLGEEEAKALGLDVFRLKILLIFTASLSCSLCVILAGNIGWVGLIIPHIARFIFGANNSLMLPGCALLGALFLLFCDWLCRRLYSFEVPLGIITSLFGIVIFVIVLRKAKV